MPHPRFKYNTEMDKSSKSFKEILDLTIQVLNEFQKVEKKNWGPEGATIELMKQVGELSRLIMSIEGYYMAGRDKLEEYQASKDKIGDELSDILMMVVRLANHYDIDLEKVHLKEMQKALNHPLMQICPEGH